MPQCLLLEKRNEADAQPLDDTADIQSTQERPLQAGSPTELLGRAGLQNGDAVEKAPSPAVAASPVPSLESSPKSPRSPRSPRSPVFANGRLSPLVADAPGDGSPPLPELKDPESDSGYPDRSAEPNQHTLVLEDPDPDRAPGERPERPASSPPSAPRRDPARRLSRIPVLEPAHLLLEAPPPGSAKEKLLQKKAHHHGPPAGPPSPAPSLSLSSDKRAPPPREPLSSASDRSQDDESYLGSRSDRQGDDAASLSSSSSPLSRKSKIPRPVVPVPVPEQLATQFLPRPPPGKPPSRPAVEGR